MDKYLKIILENNKPFVESLISICNDTKNDIDNYIFKNSIVLIGGLIENLHDSFSQINKKNIKKHNLNSDSNLIVSKNNLNNELIFDFHFNFKINSTQEDVNISITNDTGNFYVYSISFSDENNKFFRFEQNNVFFLEKNLTFISFNIGKLVNGNFGKDFFNSSSPMEELESYGLTKSIQTAIYNFPNVFTDYFYLNQNFTKEQTEMFLIMFDAKIIDSELTRYRKNINDIVFDKKNFLIKKNNLINK